MRPTYLERAREIQGWMTESELAFLYAVGVSMRPGATVVEVGSWKGRSTVAIAEALDAFPESSLHAVDTFRGNFEIPEDFRHELESDSVIQQFRRHTAGYENVHVVRQPSVEGSRLFADGTLDWVFIDAEHTYSAVLADLRAWYPKLGPGGLLSGHDYFGVEVQRAVHTFFRDVSVWETIWFTRKGRPRLRKRGVAVAQIRAGRALARMPRARSVARRLRRITSSSRGKGG